MNKKLSAVLLACGILLISGCSLAKEETVSREQDRLIGVYITEQKPELDGRNENWVEYGTFAASSQSVELQIPYMILPAEFDSENKRFVFPGLEGYALFAAEVYDEHGAYTTEVCDFFDGYLSVKTTDTGKSFELSGILYVGDKKENTVWAVNNVYQTAEGFVYLDGSGNSFFGSDFSHKLEENYTTSVDKEEESGSVCIEFSVQTIEKLEHLLVYQYNEAGERIASDKLTVSAEDKEVSWAQGAAWAVIEEQYANSVKRTVYNYSDSSTEDITHTVVILNKASVGESALIHFHL